MNRWAVLLAALLGAGCFAPRVEFLVEHDLRRLQSPEAGDREEAFRGLVLAGPAAMSPVKRSLGVGTRQGFPGVAILYAQGEGDAVPLDLRARHLAAFRWPARYAEEHAVLEPYCWREIERDLVRAGAPAVRFLAEALEREAPTEAQALRVARVLLHIGGRNAAEAFARLLDQERAFEGVRVADVAATALLYLGRRELELREVDRAARVRAAREWWARAKEQPESEWLREAVRTLADRWTPGDPQAVRPVLELLVGAPVEDPGEWRTKNPDWRPAPAPLHPGELLKRLEEGREAAFEANRLLEAVTGRRVSVPRAERLGELAAGLRLWRPGPELAVRWKREVENPLLRITIVIVGYHADRRANHVLLPGEAQFPALEDDRAELRLSAYHGAYLFQVQAREAGTRLVVSEYFSVREGTGGFSAELPGRRPTAHFSGILKGCVLAWVEEIPARQMARSPDLLFSQAKARLRAAAGEAEGTERRTLLRALGYFQDPADLPLFREHRAGEALLLLGDPAGVELAPALAPWEAEMARRKAEDPKVREYLDRSTKP